MIFPTLTGTQDRSIPRPLLVSGLNLYGRTSHSCERGSAVVFRYWEVDLPAALAAVDDLKCWEKGCFAGDLCQSFQVAVRVWYPLQLKS